MKTIDHSDINIALYDIIDKFKITLDSKILKSAALHINRLKTSELQEHRKNLIIEFGGTIHQELVKDDGVEIEIKKRAIIDWIVKKHDEREPLRLFLDENHEDFFNAIWSDIKDNYEFNHVKASDWESSKKHIHSHIYRLVVMPIFINIDEYYILVDRSGERLSDLWRNNTKDMLSVSKKLIKSYANEILEHANEDINIIKEILEKNKEMGYEGVTINKSKILSNLNKTSDEKNKIKSGGIV